MFLRFADGDVSHSLMALDRLPSAEDDFIRNCLLRDAATAYMRPFLPCRAFLTIQKLGAKYIPRDTALRALHDELTGLRNEVFAHTDLKARFPVLHCWTRGARPVFPIPFKSHTYPTLIKRVDDLRRLFETVLANVRAEQSKLEAELLSGIFR